MLLFQSIDYLLFLFLLFKIVYFHSRQEKILVELSEKDSEIADLEMNHTSTDTLNYASIIEKLNTEKQQLHNQLKELVRNMCIDSLWKESFVSYVLLN